MPAPQNQSHEDSQEEAAIRNGKSSEETETHEISQDGASGFDAFAKLTILRYL